MSDHHLSRPLALAPEFIDFPESLEQLSASSISPPSNSSKWPLEFPPGPSRLSISSDFGTYRNNFCVQIVSLQSTSISNDDYNDDGEKKKDQTLHLLNSGVKPS